jgi:hypothetical protein
LAWHDRIFRYCERGSDTGFWAEPLNAVTNGAFLLAAVVAAIHLSRTPAKRNVIAEWALIALLFAIGSGSFLFHTYATRWAAVADTAPIGLFMVAYLTYALRRFLEWPWVAILAALFLFAGMLRLAGSVTCNIGLLPATEAMGAPCLNGTAGYLPAFFSLLVVGILLALRRHVASRAVLGAAAVFAVSMSVRTLDWEICQVTAWGGRPIGTHFLWHLLNAALLYALVRTAIRYGEARR